MANGKKVLYDGFICKDQDGTVSLFLHDKPEKHHSEVGQGEWGNGIWDGTAIDGDFPMLSWDDEEPKSVKVTIEL